jgi:pimeloyl-ACP methyl ester carboxylesterase
LKAVPESVGSAAGRAAERTAAPRGRLAEIAHAGRILAKESAHFYASLVSEWVGTASVMPAFARELFYSGVYPAQMTYRKLPYRRELSDLARLQAWNPAWEFRPDFDPRDWVLVFLHGYIDNTGAVRVAHKLAHLGYQVYLVRYPFLQSVRRTAVRLAEVLETISHRERGKRIVPVGHSLGGFIWDHLILHRPSVVEQHRMPLYISMGSPRFGTLPAFFGIGRSAREMRPGSSLVRDHLRLSYPKGLEVYPFISRFDLFVLPIETALLKAGINYVFSETGHIAQVTRNETVAAMEEIMASPREVLEERAEKRAFHLAPFTWLIGQLPRPALERLGMQGIIDYVCDGDEPPEFRIRIVHHDLRTGLLPALRREV